MEVAWIAMHENRNVIQPLRCGDNYLLTPGPLTTAYETKQAMLKDWGSRDMEFRKMTADLRCQLLELINDPAGEFDCVPMQGSGTYSVEAMLGTFIPRDGKALVLANGAYGMRAAAILARMGRAHTTIDKGDYLPPRGREVAVALKHDPTITHVVSVHCETSSGILNPIEEIAATVRAAGRKLLIDGMSSFGAIPLDSQSVPFDAMASSSNKCFEGVPGFGFVIARKHSLENADGNCHSLSLDVHAQWCGMNRNGQWRFTPPTHVVAAFLEALRAHRIEGGVAGRAARYIRNRDTVVEGMRALGFETLLDDDWLSPVIVTFFNPRDEAFEFKRFYDLMKESGFVIYPGKLMQVDSFRIGCIGHLDESVMRRAVDAVGEALGAMGVRDGTPPESALMERARLAEASNASAG